MMLQRLGYTVEVLRKPWTCFDARLYSVLILGDMEEHISSSEMEKLEVDIREEGLSVLVIADWYDEVGLHEGVINDDNTHSRWYPISGGSHIPMLNDFLRRFGIEFGLQAFQGSLRYKNSVVYSVMY